MDPEMCAIRSMAGAGQGLPIDHEILQDNLAMLRDEMEDIRGSGTFPYEGGFGARPRYSYAREVSNRMGKSVRAVDGVRGSLGLPCLGLEGECDE